MYVSGKAGIMVGANTIPQADRRSWSILLASLLPLWLLSLAITVEGFPRPPISRETALASLVSAGALGIVLLWKKWATLTLLLFSLFPFLFLGPFDEISTTYKTPFIALCALILTTGAVGFQRYRSSRWSLLILVSTAAVTLLLAWHASSAYWSMADDLGYVMCFPDYQGCPPLTGQETPWWVLFFRL
jgi:hypothetical protein